MSDEPTWLAATDEIERLSGENAELRDQLERLRKEWLIACKEWGEEHALNAELLAFIRRVADAFECTDAPLGKDAHAIIAKAEERKCMPTISSGSTPTKSNDCGSSPT